MFAHNILYTALVVLICVHSSIFEQPVPSKCLELSECLLMVCDFAICLTIHLSGSGPSSAVTCAGYCCEPAGSLLCPSHLGTCPALFRVLSVSSLRMISFPCIAGTSCEFTQSQTQLVCFNTVYEKLDVAGNHILVSFGLILSSCSPCDLYATLIQNSNGPMSHSCTAIFVTLRAGCNVTQLYDCLQCICNFSAQYFLVFSCSIGLLKLTWCLRHLFLRYARCVSVSCVLVIIAVSLLFNVSIHHQISGSEYEPSFGDLRDGRRLPLVGGYKSKQITLADVHPYILPSTDISMISNSAFKFIDQVDNTGLLKYPQSEFLHARIPLKQLIELVPIARARSILKSHGMTGGS